MKIGFEFHKQITYNNKLFCKCKFIKDNVAKNLFIRKFHEIKNKLGQEDLISKIEIKKTKKNYFIFDKKNTCCVELDECPPSVQPCNRALLYALALSKKINALISKKIIFMRKIISDGSIPSGFQRTACISLGGILKVLQKRIKIREICLEEDSCFQEKNEQKKTIFNLCRSGIPLIELVTEPINLPISKVTLFLKEVNSFLNFFSDVPEEERSIRQDINFIHPLLNGRVELKGVQKLENISTQLSFELKRQKKIFLLSKKYRVNFKKCSFFSDNPTLDISFLKKKDFLFYSSEVLQICEKLNLKASINQKKISFKQNFNLHILRNILKGYAQNQILETRTFLGLETIFLRPIYKQSDKIMLETDCLQTTYTKELAALAKKQYILKQERVQEEYTLYSNLKLSKDEYFFLKKKNLLSIYSFFFKSKKYQPIEIINFFKKIDSKDQISILKKIFEKTKNIDSLNTITQIFEKIKLFSLDELLSKEIPDKTIENCYFQIHNAHDLPVDQIRNKLIFILKKNFQNIIISKKLLERIEHNINKLKNRKIYG